MKKAGLIALILIFLIPLVSADIFISLPKDVYSISDIFNFNLTIASSHDAEDFLITNLVCLSEGVLSSTEIYRMPLNLEASTQKIMQITGRFDNFLVGSLLGTCHFEAKYGIDKITSADFELVRAIYLGLSPSKVILEPNERMNVSVKATKGNGESVAEGFVEFKIDELGIISFKEIKQGVLDVMFAIPNDAAAKRYTITARAYEKSSAGEITNEGEKSITIVVIQVIRKSEISISSQDVVPESEFIYTPLLYDQTNQNIEADVAISIFNPNGELFETKSVKSGEAQNLKIEGTFMPGDWLIKSDVKGIKATRTFSVKEYEKASFNLVDNIFTVTNVGNVPYKKEVEVIIEEGSEMIDLNLGLGESARFVVSAPDGNYEVGINDGGEKAVMLGTSYLTGRAISIDAEGGGLFGGSYILIWIFLITIALVFAMRKYSKISKKSYYGQTPSTFPAPINLTAGKKDAITEGVREECAVISLKIKNNEEIEKANGDALSAVERALTRARDARAKIYSDRDYKTIIFAPSLTKEKDNSMKAVSIAREIESILNEHNRRFGEKIMFGIGVHNGEMIVELADGKFRFNSIGSTIPYTKKIADSSSHGTGVSEFVHRRILGKVKSDKIEGTNYWKIRKIMDREQHSEFISKFVQRQKENTFWKK